MKHESPDRFGKNEEKSQSKFSLLVHLGKVQNVSLSFQIHVNQIKMTLQISKRLKIELNHHQNELQNECRRVCHNKAKTRLNIPKSTPLSNSLIFAAGVVNRFSSFPLKLFKTNNVIKQLKLIHH